MVRTLIGQKWQKLSCIGFLLLLASAEAHEAKDFDDSVLYKIDFQMPDFNKMPELKNHLRTFYTHELEKYDCVIPVLDEPKEEAKANEPELSPIALLQPIFVSPSCSYRIEAYWSYEICHGHHVRQYHEEREGKNVKFQEYYLGKWNELKTDALVKSWEENRKAGIKYKTTKLDNTKYPYFEMEFGDGTPCDIIDAPRTTIVRYVCYPSGKNEIYSFKETSSCNYEAIILTSVLCVMPAFHPEESKEVSIKCFNSPTDLHKPLSMLRQELSDLQITEEDIPISKEAKAAAALWAKPEIGIDQHITYKIDGDIDRILAEWMNNGGIELPSSGQLPNYNDMIVKPTVSPIADMTPLLEFVSGKNCLTGGTGWWKYEFCYGRHVRQFHKDKKSEIELFLGFFSESAHREWVSTNPEKGAKRPGFKASIWHHYEKGTRCDRTGLPREVDVKLTCTPVSNSGTTVSMYLLEPKTCQYILVVESPIICELMRYTDAFGLVQQENVKEILDSTESKADANIKEKIDEHIRA